MLNIPVSYLPRAAPRAIESLVGQSRVFLLAASPVMQIVVKKRLMSNQSRYVLMRSTI